MIRKRSYFSMAAFLAMVSLATAEENTEPPRAARSVHLGYAAPEAAVFYNEVSVEKSVPGSYFMACGFSHGYFGIQEQGDGKKVVIFSVWDPTRGDNPNAVPDQRRVEVLFKADDVVVRRFGGEGTGGQSFFNYDWKLGQTCRFLVKATADEGKSAYAAYFFLPESKAWKHLVTFRTSTGGDRLKGLYAFIEDFRRDGRVPTKCVVRPLPTAGSAISSTIGSRCLRPGSQPRGPLGRPKTRSTPGWPMVSSTFKPAATRRRPRRWARASNAPPTPPRRRRCPRTDHSPGIGSRHRKRLLACPCPSRPRG